MNPPFIMAGSNPEIKDGCQLKQNQMHLLYAYLIIVLLVLWLEIYALPLAIVWLIARWRHVSRADKISMIAGIAVIYAIVYLFARSYSDKLDWTFIFVLLAVLSPLFDRLNRKRRT